MSMDDLIIHLFCRIADKLQDVKQHEQAKLHPSEVVTIGVMYAIKGNGYRAFYRWLLWNWRKYFPGIPDVSRLHRNLTFYSKLTNEFLDDPSFFTVMDSYGIELIHPIREDRSISQVGKKGKSNHRWIVGIKYCLLVNKDGQAVGWGWAAANKHDQVFRPIAIEFDGRTSTLTDSGFVEANAAPSNIKLCRRGEWNDRMLIETIFSLFTVLFHSKKMRQRSDEHIEAHLAYLTAALNILLSITGGKLSFTDFVF